MNEKICMLLGVLVERRDVVNLCLCIITILSPVIRLDILHYYDCIAHFYLRV